MVSRAGGSSAKRKDFDANWNLINHGLWMKVAGTPLRIHRVRGKYIRGWPTPDGKFVQVYQDFTEGGNSEAYGWMPPDLIIIDRDVAPEEQRATLIHEMEEMLVMAIDKLGYESAHSNHANPKELQYRKAPTMTTFNRLWDALTKEYRDFLKKRDGKLDRVGAKG